MMDITKLGIYQDLKTAGGKTRVFVNYDLVFVWPSIGHGCTVYSIEGEEVDHFTFGDFGQDNADYLDFELAVDSKIKQYEEDQ